ncbi:MAG: hypothetical protein WB565_00115 [Acidimicrobiales bacterium]
MTLPPLNVSGSVRRLVAGSFTPSALREIAALLEADTPAAKARAALTGEGVERLAEIVGRGGVPTIGFFRRYAKPQVDQPDRGEVDRVNQHRGEVAS